jgi:uncharacterized membrane protein YgdD (TMEM256/DUF423 family)
MNSKRIIGLVIFIIGIILICYASYQKHRIAEAQGNIQKGTSLFSGSSVGSQVGKSVGGEMEKKVSSYNTPVMLVMIAGIILLIIGAAMVLFCGKRKR